MAREDAEAPLTPESMMSTCLPSCELLCLSVNECSSRLSISRRLYNQTFLLESNRTSIYELNSAYADELRGLGLILCLITHNINLKCCTPTAEEAPQVA